MNIFPESSPARTAERARHAYAAGDYFAAHEYWEELWRAADGREKWGWQGLVLVAVGHYKAQQDKRAVAARLLRRAADRLSRGPDALDGIDLPRLAEACRKQAATLEAPGEHPRAATPLPGARPQASRPDGS